MFERIDLVSKIWSYYKCGHDFKYGKRLFLKKTHSYNNGLPCTQAYMILYTYMRVRTT